MSNEQLKFWIKCPDCRKPFGVDPRFVLQYLNRVIDAKASGEPREKAGENPNEGVENTDRPATPPGRQAPKAPYRNYRKGGSGTREWAR